MTFPSLFQYRKHFAKGVIAPRKSAHADAGSEVAEGAAAGTALSKAEEAAKQARVEQRHR